MGKMLWQLQDSSCIHAVQSVGAYGVVRLSLRAGFLQRGGNVACRPLHGSAARPQLRWHHIAGFGTRGGTRSPAGWYQLRGLLVCYRLEGRNEGLLLSTV